MTWALGTKEWEREQRAFARKMSTKKRKHVPLIEKLAAALVLQLAPEVRLQLIAANVPAARVIALFEWDHNVLHAWGGADGWANLTPMLKAEHREKSRKDTSRAAKVKRIDAKWKPFARAARAGQKPKKPQSKWPKREIRTRSKFGEWKR